MQEMNLDTQSYILNNTSFWGFGCVFFKKQTVKGKETPQKE